MFGKQMSTLLLSNVIPPYKRVVSLVAPSSLVHSIRAGKVATHGKGKLDQWSFSFAVSDPYISRVEEYGTWNNVSGKELFGLVEKVRGGGLLLSSHRLNTAITNQDMIQEHWAVLQSVLANEVNGGSPAGAHQQQVPPNSDCDEDSAKPIAYFGIHGEFQVVSSSAVEQEDLAEWLEREGSAVDPGGGAAALQLQAWIDDVQGGWPNSFA